MDVQRAQRFDEFLESLVGVPWFSNAGRPSTTYHVAADAVVAWDDWSPQMVAVWLPHSEGLEDKARGVIGDDVIETIFDRVYAAIEPSLRAGVKDYFARRPDNTENTEVGADSGLWPDIIDFVHRDMSWAAVETVLEQPDFFVSLVRVHREGRWPCSWKGQYPQGCFVVL